MTTQGKKKKKKAHAENPDIKFERPENGSGSTLMSACLDLTLRTAALASDEAGGEGVGGGLGGTRFSRMLDRVGTVGEQQLSSSIRSSPTGSHSCHHLDYSCASGSGTSRLYNQLFTQHAKLKPLTDRASGDDGSADASYFLKARVPQSKQV